MYETVLREGNAADIREWIDVEVLLAIWDEIVLPRKIRSAWREYFVRRRGLDPGPGC